MRINKYIASSGETSRRKGDELIKQGKVKVNGVLITEPGYDVLDSDVVEVEGRVLKPERKQIYLILNKPKGYITTASDDRGRPTVLDLATDIHERIFPVGRLDYQTSGLLILTNDGDFANMITHPKHKLYKTYHAKVRGLVSRGTIEKLRRGVRIEDGVTAPARVEILKQGERNTLLEIQIYEGRNRQIRRMCQEVGHEVVDLQRIAIGNVGMGHLKSGHYKKMSLQEVERLKQEAGGTSVKKQRGEQRP